MVCVASNAIGGMFPATAYENVVVLAGVGGGNGSTTSGQACGDYWGSQWPWTCLCRALCSEGGCSVVAGQLFEEAERAVLEQIPLGRMGTPRELADTALFLVSDGSSYSTGELLILMEVGCRPCNSNLTIWWYRAGLCRIVNPA
jgi:hypothetical protein